MYENFSLQIFRTEIDQSQTEMITGNKQNKTRVCSGGSVLIWTYVLLLILMVLFMVKSEPPGGGNQVLGRGD